ncbi:MAG TPA: type VI secretion system baseplate subunit TssK [Burkholderiaceae bacterium]|nr:type VI secretion system baseplate subunit TssK [Burkholderiaceae bacterium]
MTIPLKVLWCKGVALRSQHFQQQDRYHESLLHQTAMALQAYGWGVRSVGWDDEALKNKRLRLESLSAIFHEGAVFSAPHSDPLPAAVDLSTVPSGTQKVTYYAALPHCTGAGGNVAKAGANDRVRYRRVEHVTPDMLTDAADESISYLKKNVLLVSDLEPLGAYDCFPLIRLQRTMYGGFERDPSFIPPCLSVASTPELPARLNQLLEAMQAKIDALHGNLREPSPNVVEFRSGDVTSFWMLNTISTYAAKLTHYLDNNAIHPERLIEALLSLTGSLMTFSKAYKIAELPRYNHDAPGESFDGLCTIIRALLDTVISAKCFSIALEEHKTCFHTGKLDSGKLDQNTTLYLAVGASMPGVELVEVVPLRFKAGSPDDVDKGVMSALPGVKLTHAPQLPASVPVRPDTYYFTLDSKSVLYEQMMKAQSITVYVPRGFPDLRLELLAVTA